MSPSFVWSLTVAAGLLCGCGRKPETFPVSGGVYVPNGLLRAFQEPPLAPEGTKQIYRFICNRTFHEPFCIVVRVNPEGTGSLTKKILSGKGGHDRGVIKEKGEVSITAPQVQSLMALMQREQFWDMPPGEPESAIGLDGSEWFIEGVRTNHYTIVKRWNPMENTPVGRIGRLMIELAGWRIADLY